MKPSLPFITVSNNGKLERGTVKQNELLVANGVHLCHLVAELDVLSDGLVKV